MIVRCLGIIVEIFKSVLDVAAKQNLADPASWGIVPQTISSAHSLTKLTGVAGMSLADVIVALSNSSTQYDSGPLLKCLRLQSLTLQDAA